MNETLFTQAVELARAGRKKEAGPLFQSVIRADRANEMAWIWYAECLDTVQDRIRALEFCLQLNPQAVLVRQGLAKLQGANGAASGSETVRDSATARGSGPARASDEVKTRPVDTDDLTGPEPAGQKPVFLYTSDYEKNLVDQAIIAAQPTVFTNANGASPNGGAKVTAFAQEKASEKPAEEEWVLSAGSSVFTVRPDSISPEEFARIEETTADFLLNKRDIATADRQEAGWADVQLKPNGTRPLRPKKKNSGDAPHPSVFHWR